MWKGDRVYEYSYGFGLLVYDMSDPTRPRRIAHAGIPIREIAPLDNGLIAILTDDHALEIHKLPQD